MLYLHNARVWTGDPARPRATAALVQDGRFVFVGDERDIEPPADAERIDARGRLVVPGLVDAHAHLLNLGFAMRSVDLKGVRSVDEAARRVAQRADVTPPAAWIRGAGWDQHLWPGARFPDRRPLDAAAPEHPVLLTHTSGHCVWVNTAALKLAGITADPPAPYGGSIDRGEDGQPTGILRDNAARLVADVIPRPPSADRVDALRDAIAHAHSLGLTGVHAMDVGRGEYQALLNLRDTGALTLRVRAYLTHERLDEWIERGITTGDGDDMMRIGGVKFFTDGALGSMTAWMMEPYESSDDRGLALQPADRLEAMVRRGLEHGLAPAVHAIGDRANREVLDIIARTAGLSSSLPRRIEHAQLLAPPDIGRFSTLGVVASMQPIHATQDMAKVDRAWGARGQGAYAFASLQAAGATLAFGSDAPVETMDPLAGLHAAVTRRNAAGDPPDGWYPDQRLSLGDALRAYTHGAAHAVGEATTAGRIAPGYLGDLVVVSHDLFALDDPMRMLDARADVTVVGGRVVYRREGVGE